MSSFNSLVTSYQRFIQKGQRSEATCTPTSTDEPHDQPWKRMFLEEYFHRNLGWGWGRERRVIKLKNLNCFPCFPPCTNSGSRGREGKELWKTAKAIWMYCSYENLSARYETCSERVANSSLIGISGRIWSAEMRWTSLKNEKNQSTEGCVSRLTHPVNGYLHW